MTHEDPVEPSSLTFQNVTPVRPKRQELAQPSDADSQADATGMEQILKELHRMMQEVRAEVTAVKAEVQQVRTEVQVWRAEMEKWRAEMEKTVRTVELKEAQLRTQILGTAEGLVHIEQKLQEEVAQMCAKLEMMQNEQEKKKGNEEERLNALVRERVEEFEQKREEKEIARLQEYHQSLEEWLEECMCREFELQKRGQREFNKKMAEKVDKFTQEAETKVTIVLEMCEQVAEQLRKYE
jgi:chromosome segregation ATPase